jgi:hypothetical protein
LGQEIQSPNCTHCFDRRLSAIAAAPPLVPLAHLTKLPNVIGQKIPIATVQPKVFWSTKTLFGGEGFFPSIKKKGGEGGRNYLRDAIGFP